MGWFMMGIAIGWAVGGMYWYSQTDEEMKVANGASIIGVALFIIAIIVGINLGITSGAIPIEGMPTPTPLLGR